MNRNLLGRLWYVYYVFEDGEFVVNQDPQHALGGSYLLGIFHLKSAADRFVNNGQGAVILRKKRNN